MSEKTNTEILKAGYQLWGESKAKAANYWLDLIAEDISWCSVVDETSTGMEFAVDCKSKPGVLEYFEKLGERWELEFCDVENYVEQNDRVVAIGTVKWRNKKTGKSVKTKKVDFFRFRDGKIIEFTEFFDTAKAIAAAADTLE